MPPVHDWDKLNRLLDKTKGRLFFKKGAGFLGSLLCNHNFIWDEEAPTAWCNGSTIAFNPNFFLSMSIEARVTVLAHELWHTGYDHMGRAGNRDPKIYNIAADYVINNMLDTWGFSFEGINPCLDHQYDNMTTEQVYDILYEEASEAPAPTNSGSSDGSDQPGTEYDLSGDVRPSNDPTGQETMGKLIQARQASMMSNEAGIIPGEVELSISEFLSPALPWDKLLSRFMTALSQDDYSWRRPSRRYEDEYLPSLIGDNGLEHLIYYLDISGSVSDEEIRRFNSEVHYIHTEMTPEKLTLVTFDTKIQDVYVFNKDEPFEEIIVHGRGGTSLSCVHDHIKENQPTAAVIFSDLYCHPMTTNPGSPVVWITINNPSAKVSFGNQIHIKPEDI